MENLIYNELRLRGWIVDVGVVIYNTRNADGVSLRVQLEVDFVCNRGSQRIYVQSAYRLPTQEKQDQEVVSLLRIDDSFRKADLVKPHHDDNGILWINIFDVLLNADSLDL